MSYDNKNVK